MATEDEAISKPKNQQRGTDTEIISVKSAAAAKLFLLLGDHFEGSKAFRSGDFSVRVIRVSGSPVSVVTCMVGDHQWLLAKDSMAIRVGSRSYVFALPGLLYGLALPEDPQCKMLAEVFGGFSAYQDLTGINGSTLADQQKSESDNCWVSAYTKILTLATNSSTKITTSVSTPTNAAKSPPDATSTRKIQRAVRMSAAVKLLSRALLSGSLNPKSHLNISAAANTDSHVYPTMWVLAEILDAIENGKVLMRARSMPLVQGLWELKEEGVVKLMGIVKAYGSSATSEAVGLKKRRLRDGEESNLEDERKKREIEGV